MKFLSSFPNTTPLISFPCFYCTVQTRSTRLNRKSDSDTFLISVFVICLHLIQSVLRALRGSILSCSRRSLAFACALRHFSRVQLFAAHQAPLSIGFPRQGDWSGLPCPPPGDLPTQGPKPRLLSLLHCRWGNPVKYYSVIKKRMK